MSTRRLCGVALMLELAAVGCGGSDRLSPSDECRQTTVALCERYYACYTPDEIAAKGLPATQDDCVAMMESDAGCAQETEASTCTGNGTYHDDQARLCVQQISGLACTELQELNTAAPACAQICS